MSFTYKTIKNLKLPKFFLTSKSSSFKCLPNSHSSICLNRSELKSVSCQTAIVSWWLAINIHVRSEKRAQIRMLIRVTTLKINRPESCWCCHSAVEWKYGKQMQRKGWASEPADENGIRERKCFSAPVPRWSCVHWISIDWIDSISSIWVSHRVSWFESDF